MSRPRKKPAAAPGALSTQIADEAEIEARAEEVRKLWHKAGPSVALPSPEQIAILVWDIAACAAQATNAEKEQLDTAARGATQTLLRWCRYDPDAGGLPHIVFRDVRLARLENALLGAQPLAAAPPARAWTNRARSLWRRVDAIMTGRGGAGITEKAHAVQFVSAALRWAGHPGATPAAVSGEFRRRHPKV